MKIPFTPGHDDGGLAARRVLSTSTQRFGCVLEWYNSTVWDRKRWIDAVDSILSTEAADVGEIRPAFRAEVGSKLLGENEPLQVLPKRNKMG